MRRIFAILGAVALVVAVASYVEYRFTRLSKNTAEPGQLSRIENSIKGLRSDLIGRVQILEKTVESHAARLEKLEKCACPPPVKKKPVAKMAPKPAPKPAPPVVAAKPAEISKPAPPPAEPEKRAPRYDDIRVPVPPTLLPVEYVRVFPPQAPPPPQPTIIVIQQPPIYSPPPPPPVRVRIEVHGSSPYGHWHY